ncbi:MAG: hypothetical protein V4485_06195 [Pseudomonadota bacterium]
MSRSNLAIFILTLLGGVLAFFAFENKYSRQGFAQVDVLYHGSPDANIKIFEPKEEHIRNNNEGAVVFATPSLRLASCYLFRWDDSWVHQSISWKDGNKADYQVTMVISDKERLEKEDHGGAIYILPIQGFSFDESSGLGVYEWTSKDAATPITHINFVSSLDAMQKLGVHVYFVEPSEFKHYLSLRGAEQEKFLLRLK